MDIEITEIVDNSYGNEIVAPHCHQNQNSPC